MKKTVRKILVVLLIILVLIQFIRIDKTNPESDSTKDFIVVTKPNEEVTNILKTSCYDCHSNETTYPWYTNIAPVSFWIKHHINEGREELNFSEWGNYKPKRMNHKMEEAVELIENGEMPMSSYTLIHSDAELSATQKESLIAFFNSLRTEQEK